VSARSSQVSQDRPFYDRHADAYDALVTDPVEPWVEAVHRRLRLAGHDSARVLDAGCGTGRHAEALTARGHRVALLDASPRLLAIARSRRPDADAWRADLCTVEVGVVFDAVTCRGVLNDLVLDDERAAVFGSFASLCRAGGLLFLDVREATASAARATGEVQRRAVDLPDGRRLAFTSRPVWSDGRIRVEEGYELTAADGRRTSHAYAFEMRPWRRDELRDHLGAAGFTRVEIGPGVGRRTPDRLFVVAERG
jgi:SAM-dependent methyltransferase